MPFTFMFLFASLNISFAKEHDYFLFSKGIEDQDVYIGIRPEGIVILDSTNTKRCFRIDKVRSLKKLFSKTELVMFNLDKEVVLKQNKNRQYPIPEKALIEIIEEFEMPNEEDETFFDKIHYVLDNNLDEIVQTIISK